MPMAMKKTSRQKQANQDGRPRKQTELLSGGLIGWLPQCRYS
jgi:hypothetical protein